MVPTPVFDRRLHAANHLLGPKVHVFRVSVAILFLGGCRHGVSTGGSLWHRCWRGIVGGMHSCLPVDVTLGAWSFCNAWLLAECTKVGCSMVVWSAGVSGDLYANDQWGNRRPPTTYKDGKHSLHF